MRRQRLFGMAAVIALPVVLGAASCPPEETAIQLCDVYALSLKTAAGFRAQGKLTPTQVAQVDEVRTVINPICTAETVPDGPQIREDLREGLRALAQINADATQ